MEGEVGSISIKRGYASTPSDNLSYDDLECFQLKPKLLGRSE